MHVDFFVPVTYFEVPVTILEKMPVTKMKNKMSRALFNVTVKNINTDSLYHISKLGTWGPSLVGSYYYRESLGITT